MSGTYIGDAYAGNTYPAEFGRELPSIIPQGGVPRSIQAMGRRVFPPTRRVQA